ATYTVMPDRIEAGTYAIATAIAGGEIELAGAERNTIAALLVHLEQAGADVRETERGLKLYVNGGRPKSVDLTTAPFPGFPTDLQAQFMALMTVGSGTATIRETIFENRFMHAVELARLGASIDINGNTAVVKGVARLEGATVMATDLRASASLVIAALVAQGETLIERIYHLDRGYERIEEKLSKLGASVRRVR
ncbi:MAG: UDP-N-acetylglucosamine 1-carboxyvinyltransferase, partial [Betaproteobacteria bacterium]|nr:UDP-N-acetylglucosamine 1-carboxyvinyltransferase [Betaproteobacteria bacterium]